MNALGRRLIVFLACAAMGLAVGPALAQSLEHDVSHRTVEIRPTFRGAELIFFGSIQPELSGGAIDPTAPLDIVVVVRGPPRTYKVRRKERVAGIWINRSGETLHDVPGFYFVGSTRPLQDIASPKTLSRYSIGAASWDLVVGEETLPEPATVAARPPDSSAETPVEAAPQDGERLPAVPPLPNRRPLTMNTLEAETPSVPPDASAGAEGDPFRAALRRSLLDTGTLVEAEGGVQVIGRHLFRVGIAMPAVVPQGIYGAEVYLLQNNSVVDAQYSTIAVDKKGLERAISELATEHSIFYGFAAVAIAVFFGWLSSVLIRRI